mmetsp:Transcript_3179/g.3082  ORF Transcript_3179/g.3082 Transcript_3179/m.3082 type:complete len:108 (-) Transcript_3179:534-857(-)
MEIMSRIDHPNIVKLHRLFEDDSTYALVMELMTGGEVFDYIVDRDHLSEQEAAALIRPIIDAINYCHHLGIIHRDLKVSSILLLRNYDISFFFNFLFFYFDPDYSVA